MISTQSGSLKLFRFSGIQVYLHWSWFVVALIEISSRAGLYSSPVWNAAEYLGLFAIVLMHEFGHSLAARQTGGKAEEIILWPFGGIAFVNAPQRPGAQLWSIAAGPLVNVVLIPVLFGVAWLAHQTGFAAQAPDFIRFLRELSKINVLLLVFNVMPIYPLDGGQILRSLLWFPLGRARSLQIATVIGFIGMAGLLALAVWLQSWWIGLITLFLGQQCLNGYKHAQALFALQRMPRHQGFACPSCKQAPPGGPLWRCGNCHQPFDPFSTRAVCPHCATRQPVTPCAYCGAAHPIEQWQTSPSGYSPPPIIDV